jgi:DNA-binding beta-propeller fold protein YncE
VIAVPSHNAAITVGCSASPPTIAVPGYPGAPGVNEATDTVYVATFTGTVAVINGATCNATVTTGCGQTPATVTVGGAFGDIAVDQATNTIYAPNYVTNTVSVIDGNTCNATTSSGCGQTPPAVNAGVGASSVAVDQHTKTVYVANTGSYPFYGPGAGTTVSMINAATCNATVTSGCGQTPPTFTSGNGPYAVRINPVTDTVYIVNFGDYAVVAVSARTCNATNATGCQVSPPVPVGGAPSNVGISQATGTVYVANSADNNVSVFGPNFTQK